MHVGRQRGKFADPPWTGRTGYDRDRERNRGTPSAGADRQPWRDRHPHRQGRRRRSASSRVASTRPPTSARCTPASPPSRATHRRRRPIRSPPTSTSRPLVGGGQSSRLRLRAPRLRVPRRERRRSPSAAPPRASRSSARRPETLALFGDKVARPGAGPQSLGIPVRRRQRRRRGVGGRCGARAADEIGYPVMLKAAAGGGGRGHARRRPARRHGRGVRALPQRGDGGVRRRRAVRRAADRPAPPHRGPDPRRRPRQRRPPLRPRLLGAAAQPEGRRGRARRRASTAALRARILGDAVALARGRRLRQRRHRRVPRRRPRPASTSSSSATRASRSSTRSPSRSPASTWSRRSSASPPGRRSPTSGWPTRTPSARPRLRRAGPGVATGAGVLHRLQGAVGRRASASTPAATPATPRRRSSTRCWPRSSARPPSAVDVAAAVDRTRRALACSTSPACPPTSPSCSAILAHPDVRAGDARTTLLAEAPELVGGDGAPGSAARRSSMPARRRSAPAVGAGRRPAARRRARRAAGAHARWPAPWSRCGSRVGDVGAPPATVCS